MLLTDKVKTALQYVGIIGASLAAVAYIIVVLVLIQGFNLDVKSESSVAFSIINAAVGLLIMQLLKIQGISFAKAIPENDEILKKYYNTKTADRKFHSINYYWLTTVIKDILIKGITVGATTFGIIYIAIQGSNDYHLMLLAVVNVILFACFGLLSLNSAYDYYNNEHIPFLKEKLKLMEEPNHDDQGKLRVSQSGGASPKESV